jgi:hypothetical protein
MKTETMIPASENVSRISVGAAVRLAKANHPNSNQRGVIIAALANPSGRSANQWYDVRFNNGRLGRFRKADLEGLS